jgi:hypothetical protein
VQATTAGGRESRVTKSQLRPERLLSCPTGLQRSSRSGRRTIREVKALLAEQRLDPPERLDGPVLDRALDELALVLTAHARHEDQAGVRDFDGRGQVRARRLDRRSLLGGGRDGWVSWMASRGSVCSATHSVAIEMGHGRRDAVVVSSCEGRRATEGQGRRERARWADSRRRRGWRRSPASPRARALLGRGSRQPHLTPPPDPRSVPARLSVCPESLQAAFARGSRLH